ncbi:limonene-1,2-epoxide hydrolase family protein [Govanella unica]|uniref:Nuclear transport factor 2 family protein n=1 Tax=Govanella unica TaxID=2975056 RepID=A0A9X3TY76_9PROT|nr:nuclear transport factor 2 family protein [Govania unica]MDA5193838.1 nuclear transport factor 2 family protein [Govania unica]
MSKTLSKLLATIFFCASLFSFSGGAAMADTDAQKIDAVKQMFDAWNKLDWERAINMFAEDGVLHSVMQDPINGRKAIAERLHILAKGTEKLQLQVKNMGIINGLVFVERVDDFVFNGNHGRVPVVGVLKVEGGKIKEWREYYDRHQLESSLTGKKE